MDMNLIYTISNDWYGTTIHIHLNSEYQPIRKKVIIPFPGHESHFVAIFYKDR